MTTLTFDTLKFVQRLEKAGVSREQAEARAEALAEVFDSAGQDLATKSDLKFEVSRIDNRIDALTKELQAVELRLTIKLGAFMAASVGTTVALIKLL
jgi:hypothetical protein